MTLDPRVLEKILVEAKRLAAAADDAADRRMWELRARQPKEAQSPASPSADELAGALERVLDAQAGLNIGDMGGAIVAARALLARRRAP